MSLKLIVGLGNPGEEYKNTRHNAGFMVIDKMIETLNIKLTSNKFKGLYAKSQFNNQDFIIAKPMTFMNLSGTFVRELTDFFKIWPQNILVIYDDFAFDLGQIKLRQKGSSGGHNGMANIIKCMNTDKIKRIRFGVGPLNQNNISNFVLSKFNLSDYLLLDTSIVKSSVAAFSFLEESDFSIVMNKHNK
ncbi:aminoacyl-tRNA hydrolase [Mycoplasmoides pirum]|uniref:aminoacyl-tRNA hydrolase n=1 Tax=Mycoplasmoides pirum TaxID=2122 RepID=UPI0004832307|nr:aminoacyl-tRNA hydrolase [Mycoplasmoides pirum]